MSPLFTSGTRPGSLQSEEGLFLTDFSVDPKYDYNDVLSVPVGGVAPATTWTEAWNQRTEIKLTGTPILTAGAALQGLAALQGADTLTSLANLIDDEVFGIQLSVGIVQSRDPSLKKARSGTGREFTLNLTHFPGMV